MSSNKSSKRKKDPEDETPTAKKKKTSTSTVNTPPYSYNTPPHTPSSGVPSPITSSASLPFKNPNFTRRNEKRNRTWKNLKQILAAENYGALSADVATYVSIEASPSVRPLKKYCDLTGYIAPYRDPKTGIRYSHAALYGVIRQLSDEAVQQYLGLRRAQVVLR